MQQSGARRRTAEEATFELLRRLEQETIFAGPGWPWRSRHPAAPEGFRIVANDQCATAVTMASAYARITGAPATVAVASEMDVLSTAAPLLAATQGGDPLVIVVLTRPGWRDSAAARMLPGPWAKGILAAAQRRFAPSVLAAAFELSVQSPPGPVLVMVPAQPASPGTPSSSPPPQRGPRPQPAAPPAGRPSPGVAERRAPGRSTLGTLDVARILRDVAPEDTVLVDDGRVPRGPMAVAWPTPQPDMRHRNLHGISGWELPFAAGVALAERDLGRMRPVLAIASAASLLATLSSLAAAVHLRLPLLTVALNEHGQQLHAPASAYGAHVVSVRGVDALTEAAAAAWRHESPAIVNLLPR